MHKNIGIELKAPELECNDKNCPFHGKLKCHGNIFTGTVTSTKMHKTAGVEWAWHRYIPKYERYTLIRTKVKAHNTPCINATEGDIVKIIGCRPLSKTKNFVIIEKFGKDIGYIVKKESIKEDATDKGKDN